MSQSNGTTAVAERPGEAGHVEAALIQGDLSKLNPQQRLQHYVNVCNSLGLNPHTQPFDYITFQGKLRLYAKKDCTEQMRKIHGVTIVGDPVKRVDDGVLSVTVRVRDKSGREDVDEGAVVVAGLKGEALANAHMKALTKAKRRATLSICGLGWLDETEIDSIPGAVRPPDADNALPAHQDATTRQQKLKALREAYKEARARGVMDDGAMNKLLAERHAKEFKALTNEQIDELHQVLTKALAEPEHGDAYLPDALPGMADAAPGQYERR